MAAGVNLGIPFSSLFATDLVLVIVELRKNLFVATALQSLKKKKKKPQCWKTSDRATFLSKLPSLLPGLLPSEFACHCSISSLHINSLLATVSIACS